MRLYLRCIGIEPTAPGVQIQAQYQAVKPKQRKHALSIGRRLVRETGSVPVSFAPAWLIETGFEEIDMPAQKQPIFPPHQDCPEPKIFRNGWRLWTGKKTNRSGASLMQVYFGGSSIGDSGKEDDQ